MNLAARCKHKRPRVADSRLFAPVSAGAIRHLNPTAPRLWIPPSEYVRGQKMLKPDPKFNDVIFLADLHPFGYLGERVKVKRGFYRNFLHPRKCAVLEDEKTLEKYHNSLPEEYRQQLKRRRANMYLHRRINGRWEMNITRDGDWESRKLIQPVTMR